MKKRTHPSKGPPLGETLPPELLNNIHSLNPWWRNEAAPKPPSFHRWMFKRLNHMLHEGLTPATVLRGPRRVGKTVLLRQIIEDLLASGVPPSRILYLPFDELPTMPGIQEPVLTIGRWFEREIVGRTFNAAAQQNQPAYLLLDEVQNLESWAPQVKNLVDNHSVRMLITGSSSLRIEAGRDSLAGRITTMDLGSLLPREIAELRFGMHSDPIWDDGSNGIATLDFWRQAVSRCAEQADLRRRAFRAFSERGGYPVAHERKDAPWPEIADYLEETIIQRALKHDLTMGPADASSTADCWRRYSDCAAVTRAKPRENGFLYLKSAKPWLSTSDGTWCAAIWICWTLRCSCA